MGVGVGKWGAGRGLAGVRRGEHRAGAAARAAAAPRSPSLAPYSGPGRWARALERRETAIHSLGRGELGGDASARSRVGAQRRAKVTSRVMAVADTHRVVQFHHRWGFGGAPPSGGAASPPPVARMRPPRGAHPSYLREERPQRGRQRQRAQGDRERVSVEHGGRRGGGAAGRVCARRGGRRCSVLARPPTPLPRAPASRWWAQDATATHAPPPPPLLHSPFLPVPAAPAGASRGSTRARPNLAAICVRKRERERGRGRGGKGARRARARGVPLCPPPPLHLSPLHPPGTWA